MDGKTGNSSSLSKSNCWTISDELHSHFLSFFFELFSFWWGLIPAELFQCLLLWIGADERKTAAQSVKNLWSELKPNHCSNCRCWNVSASSIRGAKLQLEPTATRKTNNYFTRFFLFTLSRRLLAAVISPCLTRLQNEIWHAEVTVTELEMDLLKWRHLPSSFAAPVDLCSDNYSKSYRWIGLYLVSNWR